MFCVHSYVHHDGSIGVICGFKCGTDFTFRTPEFKTFMDNVCMALAANGISEEEQTAGLLIPSPKVLCVHDEITIDQYTKQISEQFKEEIWVDPEWYRLSDEAIKDDFKYFTK